MSIGAGQLLWWDGLDLSHDIRVADGMAERQFGDRTGLIHKRTQNKPVGVVEDGLSLSGFFVANTTGQLIAEESHKTGGYVSRSYGDTFGSHVTVYRELELPSSGHVYNIGGFIDFSADDCKASLDPMLGRLIYATTNPNARGASAGIDNYESADLGASPGSIAPTMILHVGHITRGSGIASAHISLQHSTNNNTWASYRASQLDIDIVDSQSVVSGLPGTLTAESTTPANLNRYVRARMQAGIVSGSAVGTQTMSVRMAIILTW